MSLVDKHLCIGKMTCINCQNKIEQKLRNTAGITKAEVSYSNGTADITYDTDLISLNDIVAIVESLGYEVLPEQKENQIDIIRIISILIIIISLYILLQQLGILNLLVPSQLADSSMGYGMLFIVGLITSVHCIAMCGGINLTQCIPKQNASTENTGKLSVLRPTFLYNTGRVISYTVVGFILGLIGMLFSGGFDAGLPALIQGILKLIAGLFMVVMGINMLGIFPWLRKINLRLPKAFANIIGKEKAKSKQPLIVGLLNGLMPCGPLQSMQIVALASANPFVGVLSMLLFSLGTVPLMLGFGSVVSVLGRKFATIVMNVGSVLVVVLGLAMLSQGGSLSGLLMPDKLLILVIALSVLGVIASLPLKKLYKAVGFVAAIAVIFAGQTVWSCFEDENIQNESASVSEAEIINGVQVINSTLSPGSYPSITVQAGIPVKWIINAPEGSINGCNYKMILWEYDIEYIFQEGENVIEFVPNKAGTYGYTCWMGMIHGNIYVADENGEIVYEDAEQANYSNSSFCFCC